MPLHRDATIYGALASKSDVRRQETACNFDSRFSRKLSGTTGHRLLGTQKPQLLCVVAWVWFCLSTEFVCFYIPLPIHTLAFTASKDKTPSLGESLGILLDSVQSLA